MLRTPLGRYRLLAYIVGVGLVVLVFIGVPLRYGLDFPYIAKYVGMLHGFLYIVYCVACLELVLRYRLHVVRLLLMAAAGFVPFLSFVMERKTTHYLQAREAAAHVQPAGLSTSAN
jgi:integral membrane protein